MKNLGRRAVFTKVSDGMGFEENDKKYFSELMGKELSLVKHINGNLYLTNLYVKKFEDENNDYYQNGFAKITLSNITFLD